VKLAGAGNQLRFFSSVADMGKVGNLSVVPRGFLLPLPGDDIIRTTANDFSDKRAEFLFNVLRRDLVSLILKGVVQQSRNS
jgi:hypothetical protein